MTQLQEIYEDTQRRRVSNGMKLYNLPHEALTVKIPDELSYVGTNAADAEFTIQFRDNSLDWCLVFVCFCQTEFRVTYAFFGGDVEHEFSYHYDESLCALALDEKSPFHLVAREQMLFYPEAVASLLGCPDDVETVSSLLREYPSQVRSMMGWA